MYLMPLPFLLHFLFGLASIVLLIHGVDLIRDWCIDEKVDDVELYKGAAMVLWSFFGRFVVLAFFKRGKGDLSPKLDEAGETVRAPDGSGLHIEADGLSGIPSDASADDTADRPTVVLTHGWALDSSAWYSVRKQLASRYRLILWDLPGLGRSTQPADGKYSITALAEDLHRVIAAAGNRPVVLVGHSIGGMMIQTLYRLRPELFGKRIKGIVLVDTTYTYPLKTVIFGGLLRLLRWPVIEPLLWLSIVLWPLVWLKNWQSYLNGSTHILNRFLSFSRGVTRDELEFGARFTVKHKPSVLAKGLLAILRWDESETASRIAVPTRIIVGDADKLTRPCASERLNELIPHADLVCISPAGHTGIIEEGEQYAAAIAEFVDTLADTASPDKSGSDKSN